MRNAFRIFVMLICCAAAICAQEVPKYLHISTNPSYADAYVDKVKTRINSRNS